MSAMFLLIGTICIACHTFGGPTKTLDGDDSPFLLHFGVCMSILGAAIAALYLMGRPALKRELEVDANSAH